MTNVAIIKLLVVIGVLLAVIAGIAVRRETRERQAEQNLHAIRDSFRHAPEDARPVVSPDVWKWQAK